MGGTWTLIEPSPGDLEMTWTGVPYFGDTATASFTIRYIAATQELEFDGLAGIQASTAAQDSFLGMSPGSLVGGATDPGPAPWTVGAAGAANLATDMLYEFTVGVTQPASVLGGLNKLTFTPDGGGNYIWAGN